MDNRSIAWSALAGGTHIDLDQPSFEEQRRREHVRALREAEASRRDEATRQAESRTSGTAPTWRQIIGQLTGPPAQARRCSRIRSPARTCR